jgi:hypothetical protein
MGARSACRFTVLRGLARTVVEQRVGNTGEGRPASLARNDGRSFGPVLQRHLRMMGARFLGAYASAADEGAANECTRV